MSKYEKLYAKEFDSKHDDYRDIKQKEKLISFTIKLPC